MKRLAIALLLAAAVAAGGAAPVTYEIDPAHTYPSFEADHLGISLWRGKLNRSSGTLTFDKEAGSGSIDITIDLASIDFGHDALNDWARGHQFFDVEKFPQASYKGRFDAVKGSAPLQVLGQLSLHGITRPLPLVIHSLKCIPHPLHRRELCGADASASFRRDDFGLDAGKQWGFRMDVLLRIQVEAVAAE